MSETVTTPSPREDLQEDPREDDGTAARVARILRDSVGVDGARIHPEARLVEDLGIDSLDRIELVFELESAFGIEIPDQAVAQVETVGDVVSRIDAVLDGGRAAGQGERG
jgi:acyl carrier protein